MDLDDFRGLSQKNVRLQGDTAKDAVTLLDDLWYSDTNRRGRWMDLIGDYAGNEMFVIDGDSLLQLVLDDPMLALGRHDDLSFQILHAKYALEKISSEFLQRSAVFEVVFWQGNRHLTQSTGDSMFVVASRILARQMLGQHLGLLSVPVSYFQSISDPGWMQYVLARKPMFIMLNDGDALEDYADPAHVECMLLQRFTMFSLVSQGHPLALLRGSEFRDSKILTFIFEQQVDPQIKAQLQGRFLSIIDSTTRSLEDQEVSARGVFTPASVAGLLGGEAEDDADANNAMERFVKVMSLSLKNKPSFSFALLHVFVSHCSLLPRIPVESRARVIKSVHPKLDRFLRDVFLPAAFLALERTQHGTGLDVDGRVFLELLRYTLRNTSMHPRDIIGQDAYAEVDKLWRVHHLPALKFMVLASIFPMSTDERPSPIASSSTNASFTVMPFANSVFDEAFSSMPLRVDIDKEHSVASKEFNIPFMDDHHWHNHRRAILPKYQGGRDGDSIQLTEWQRKKKLRSDQRFMAKMQWQAASLSGASGKALQRITIVSGQERSVLKSKVHAPGTGDGSSSKPKSKKVHISKAEAIRQQNAEKKKSEQDSSNVTWWTDQLLQMDSLTTFKKIAHIERLLSNPRVEDGWLAVEIRLYRIHLEFSLWVEDPLADGLDLVKQGKLRDRFTVAIVRMAKELYERGGLFPKALGPLESALRALGFQDYLPSLLSGSPDPSNDDRKLSFKFSKLFHSKTKAPVHKFMRIAEEPVEWQLRLFGEFMDRSMDGQYDRRVSFMPDAWQRRVLDCLDRNHSLLVVAPTSAGKTFISYYAMEQVLRDSDEGVLVYVAPTKALVSQIAAEVYARYNKVFKSSGKTCWSIHTRDYRINDPQNCQILVTVPEMLAIMLLSPALAKVWMPRIKRIILDEIHTIGQQEGGAVWEQIILLAPCPIIGLSATIGEPEKFNAWLASVQKAHGYEHTYINHPHRYSHLRKFFYALHAEAPENFRGLDTYRNTGRMRFIHPASMLAFGARVLPPDFSLEAADCLSLFNALQSLRTTSYNSDFNTEPLCPSHFFRYNLKFLQQKDIIDYENALKDTLTQVISRSDPQDTQSPLALVLRRLEDRFVAGWNSPASSDDVLAGLIHLVSDLHTNGDLPALLFLFDRSGCEIAAQRLLAALRDTEAQWRESSPVWQRTVAQWKQWQSQAASRVREAERQLKLNKKAAEDPREAREASWEESFNPKDPSPQFSFLGVKTSKETLEAAITELGWTSTPSWVIDALRRGVGIHHSGMNKHYRTTVESLYRMGYLQVVFATGTLALGINAPTKTSVFCADSPFLTALMYRQCAGRAGRRGFDLLGKVIFYGLSMDRVQRLVLSKLPSLGGSFPLTSTMVLRLFNLLQGSDCAPNAVSAISSILNLPQVSFVSKTGRQEIMHHIRFSIDYLRRSGLMDCNGNPINLFGLATHLYYTEPSNFAIVTLLREGVIHDICTQPSVEGAKKDLLLLLCHLFGRRYVPKVYTSGQNIKSLLNKSPSKVILPPIHEAAKAALSKHNRETLRIFTGYALAYVTEYQDTLGQEQSLPLSNIAYPGHRTASHFIEHLESTSSVIVARSPFVANSGHDDNFRSVEELVTTVHSGIHLKEHGIPSLQHFTQESTASYPLNAYLFDFYMHGQVEALVKANGIRRGELWYLLQDFSLTLKTIRSSIEHLLINAASASEPLDDNDASADPAEMDGDEGVDRHVFERPHGVSQRDWRLFEVVNQLTEEFDEKFRAIWA